METTKDRLRKIMAERNLRAVDIAERSGLSRGAISQYLSGKVTPKQNKIYLLAKALNVEPSYLMGIDEPSPKNTEPTRDWLRQLCAGNDKALAALDRLSITENGEIKLDGGDVASQAILQHQIRTLISALEAATDNGDGTKTAVWKP